AREHPEHGALGLDRLTDDEIQLGPVAGRDRDRLVDVGHTTEVANKLVRALVGQRQALAHLDRRRLVRDTDREQFAQLTGSRSRLSDSEAPCSSETSRWSSANSRRVWPSRIAMMPR